MALPTNTDLIGMDWFFEGEPFIHVASKNSIDLSGMDWYFCGEPFVVNPFGSIAYNIKSIGRVLLTNIKSINGITIANIKSIGKVSKL